MPIMKITSSEKIAYSCRGQHYLIDLTDQDQEFACSVCGAAFTVAKKRVFVLPPDQHPVSKSQSDSIASARTKDSDRFTIPDRFIGILFRLGKAFASLLGVGSLLAAIASIGVFAWNLRTEITVPAYSDLVASQKSVGEAGWSNAIEFDQRMALEKKHGEHVADLVKHHGFARDDYDVLMRMLSHIQEENRSAFVEGLEKLLLDRSVAAEKDPKNTPSAEEVAAMYIEVFGSVVTQYESDEKQSQTTRWIALGAAFMFCFMLSMMLIVTAMLRIEKNTRKAASGHHL
jgi:hypothetical protein